MKLICLSFYRKRFFLFLILVFSFSAFSQNEPAVNNEVPVENQQVINQPPSQFWNRVQFGGGLGLGFSSGYTEISVLPSAIYNVNEIFAVGTGLQFSYVASKNYYSNFVYGVNGLVLVNPIPQIQLSIGLNESYVNYDFEATNFEPSYSDNYWATSMVAGIGYRTGNVTVGVGFTVFDTDPYYDNNPIIPFVRAYF